MPPTEAQITEFFTLTTKLIELNPLKYENGFKQLKRELKNDKLTYAQMEQKLEELRPLVKYLTRAHQALMGKKR